MSDYRAISLVSQTLFNLLKDHITDSSDTELNGVPIRLETPKEVSASPNKTGVSLWLYRVVRNGDTLNQPSLRVVPNQLPLPPLPINLHYLVTPLQQEPKSEQNLLGRVLQVFNDHPVLRGSDLATGFDGDEELRLSLETLSLEELTRIWDALKEPYQLSVSYLVQLVSIESDHEPVQASPVLVKEAKYTQILSS